MDWDQRLRFISFQTSRVVGIGVTFSGLSGAYQLGYRTVAGAYFGGRALMQSMGRSALPKAVTAPSAESLSVASLTAKEGVDLAVESCKQIAGKMTGYTHHGLNQAIGRNGGRGVSALEILRTLKEPEKIIEQARGAVKYTRQGTAVILNAEGKLITTYGKNRGPQVWDYSGVVQPPNGSGAMLANP